MPQNSCLQPSLRSVHRPQQCSSEWQRPRPEDHGSPSCSSTLFVQRVFLEYVHGRNRAGGRTLLALLCALGVGRGVGGLVRVPVSAMGIIGRNGQRTKPPKRQREKRRSEAFQVPMAPECRSGTAETRDLQGRGGGRRGGGGWLLLFGGGRGGANVGPGW